MTWMGGLMDMNPILIANPTTLKAYPNLISFSCFLFHYSIDLVARKMHRAGLWGGSVTASFARCTQIFLLVPPQPSTSKWELVSTVNQWSQNLIHGTGTISHVTNCSTEPYPHDKTAMAALDRDQLIIRHALYLLWMWVAPGWTGN